MFLKVLWNIVLCISLLVLYYFQSENLGDMVDKMKSFVDKVSSYEGAEVPTQHSEGTNLKFDTDNKTPDHDNETDTKLDGDRKLGKNVNRTTASSGDLDTRNMGLKDRLEHEDFDEDEEFDPILFVKTLKELLGEKNNSCCQFLLYCCLKRNKRGIG